MDLGNFGAGLASLPALGNSIRRPMLEYLGVLALAPRISLRFKRLRGRLRLVTIRVVWPLWRSRRRRR